MFKFLYEFIIDPLELPIACHFEYMILFAIGVAAYLIAFSFVGKLYSKDIITSKEGGTIIHWSVRTLVFVILFIIIKFAIILAKWIVSNKFLVIGILFTIILLSVTVFSINKKIKKAKKLSNK